MKYLLRIFLALMLIGTSAAGYAQKAPKFGHINFAELYAMMPGQDTIQTKYQQYATELRTTLEAMQAELENKYTDYQTNLSKYTEIIKKTKERELQDLQSRIENFQMSAQQDLGRKEEELTKPIIDKARKAIEEVAKEGGYTYIFNASEGLLLFSDGGDNIMPLVKKKLGIQ
ncbi:MAG TPA: OmpH family outer membrane protein [Bacteroidales bacterium]|nr:OmpH family outer membrane protein [Lentimicrobiaceae bacterium]HOI00437.1 OmpH family outer membrane protein [Bacteroidales bacterium]